MRTIRRVEARRAKGQATGEPPRWRRKGQALYIVVGMMLVLILMTALAVDVGLLMGKRAKLQSAVDSAALSAVQMLVANTGVTTSTKASQILEANSIPISSLSAYTVTTVPYVGNQIRIQAVQRVNTFFIRVIPAWSAVDISAEATADINSYAEINAKPYGIPGVVNELNLMVWGADSWRRGGDAYSPRNWPNGGTEPSPTALPNPLANEQSYGYLYRIDVPSSYLDAYDKLEVQFFDPDSYNRPGTPQPTPTTTYINGTPQPTATMSGENYAYCTNVDCGSNSPCTSRCDEYNTGVRIGAFTGYPTPRPAFWRVDEIRPPYNMSFNTYYYNSSHATTTRFSLWHFNPRITSAFGDPSRLSDQGTSPMAEYTVGWDGTTDLKWYRPPGFQVRLKGGPCGGDCFDREANNGMYFYLYVKGTSGSSENNHDIRVGPPQDYHDCSTPCDVNTQYRDGVPNWVTGGAQVLVKRALPLNLLTGQNLGGGYGVAFPMLFTQVSEYASGQTLRVRHFDQDGNGGLGSVMRYQMQLCGCTDTANDACFTDVGTGWVGGNDTWTDGNPNHELELVTIPSETSAYFRNPSTGQQCESSWLRMYRYPSYAQDTTVWEMPFLRPRLIR